MTERNMTEKETITLTIASSSFVLGGSAMVCCGHGVFGGISFGLGVLLWLAVFGKIRD